MKKSLLGYSLMALVLLALINHKVFAQKIKSLEGQSVKELKLKTPDDAKFLIGQEFKIGVIAVLADGTELPTKGFLDGKLKWKEFNVTVSGGTFDVKGTINADGFVQISDDPKNFNNHKITVTVVNSFAPDVKATADFTVSYAVNKSTGFAGQPGVNAPSKSRSGGYTYGQNGERGQTGGTGGRGPAVEVFVKTIKDGQGKDLLDITYSSNNGGSGYYIIDPNGGSIVVDAVGGRGGYGGSGTDGYDGGESNNRLMGSGNGGDGGDGGSGGEGGSVTFYIDPSAEKYKDALIGRTSGGDGGNPGRGGNPGPTRGTFTNEKNKYGVDHIPSGSKGQDGRKGINGINGTVPVYIIKKLDNIASTPTVTPVATTTAPVNTPVVTKPDTKPATTIVEKKTAPINTPAPSTKKVVVVGDVKPFQEKYSNGTIKTTGQKKNDQKTGVWNDFDENGKLISKNEYGAEESTVTTTNYAENGNTISVESYVKGQKSGVWKIFNPETGKLTNETTYSNDVMNGVQKVYNSETGKIQMEGSYKDDAQDGVWKIYDETGKVRQSINYKNGEVVE